MLAFYPQAISLDPPRLRRRRRMQGEPEPIWPWASQSSLDYSYGEKACAVRKQITACADHDTVYLLGGVLVVVWFSAMAHLLVVDGDDALSV